MFDLGEKGRQFNSSRYTLNNNKPFKFRKQWRKYYIITRRERERERRRRAAGRESCFPFRLSYATKSYHSKKKRTTTTKVDDL